MPAGAVGKVLLADGMTAEAAGSTAETGADGMAAEAAGTTAEAGADGTTAKAGADGDVAGTAETEAAARNGEVATETRIWPHCSHQSIHMYM